MRIASFNVENLDDRPGAAPSLAERVRVLRPQLERLDADVVCLQEVNAQKPARDPRGRREFRALDALIEETEFAAFHRVTSLGADGTGPADVHNLVILSRRPIAGHRQYWHDLVTPPVYRGATAVPPVPAADVVWDRPVLHAWIDLEHGRRLEVFNTHLRAPLAAFVPGQKEGPFTWKTAAGWAEGFYLATMKRAGQALEARLAVDRVFDADADALIVVCGDMNAELSEMPIRILMANVDDTANGALAGRVLVPIERAVPESLRFSVVHAGRSQMLDHLLVSRALQSRCRGVEIHNEGLEDEVVGYAAAHPSPVSYHAPIVAEFDLGPVRSSPNISNPRK